MHSLCLDLGFDPALDSRLQFLGASRFSSGSNVSRLHPDSAVCLLLYTLYKELDSMPSCLSCILAPSDLVSGWYFQSIASSSEKLYRLPFFGSCFSRFLYSCLDPVMIRVTVKVSQSSEAGPANERKREIHSWFSKTLRTCD